MATHSKVKIPSFILPRGFTDIRALPVLVEEMLRRGWSEERVRKVMGGNILRVIGAVRP